MRQRKVVAVTDHFWGVVPAGGAGTRLWPLSRAATPKFLRDLTGSGRTLLEQTYDRLQPLCDDRLLVVTGRAHEDAVREQLDMLADDAVLAEPERRDSMAAIGLAAALLERRDSDAIMGSFAADHAIADPDAFAGAVRTAIEVAADGWLVTLGMAPSSPSSAFGYIRSDAAVPGHPNAQMVAEFVEKPTVDVAERYVADGYRWNAGMFVVRPGVLLDLLATWHPDFAETLRAIAAEPDTLDARWAELPTLAIDHAVAEPAAAAGKVATVPADFAWDDIGGFDSLAGLLGDDGPTVLGDTSLVRAIDTSGLVVPHSGRTVAVIGLDDIVVVDTPDAVLVTTRERAQEVKKIVAELPEELS